MLTVRTDVTDRMLIFSGRPLRSILAEYSASRIEAQVKASGRVMAPHKSAASSSIGAESLRLCVPRISFTALTSRVARSVLRA